MKSLITRHKKFLAVLLFFVVVAILRPLLALLEIIAPIALEFIARHPQFSLVVLLLALFFVFRRLYSFRQEITESAISHPLGKFIARHWRFFVAGAIFIFILSLGVFIWAGSSQLGFNDLDYRTNLYTELFGVLLSVFISVVVIGLWTDWRERGRLKRRLVREAGSRSSNDLANMAIDQLRAEGWLIGEDGLLKGANLERAKLSGADLRDANLGGASLWEVDLGGADLMRADLGGAYLMGADLGGAYLMDADLGGADLMRADLGGASLWDANLGGASLMGADLGGASLWDANLGGVFLRGATFSDETILENTTMPDGTVITLKDGIADALARFTDRTHPDFAKTLEKIKSIRQEMGLED